MAIINNNVKFYKDFLIIDRYFASIDLYDENKIYKEFNRSSRQLIEDKEVNRSSIKFEEYYSNGTIENAIDNYHLYKNMIAPKIPYSQILDFCFNELKMNVQTFNNIFGIGNEVKNRYADFQHHYDAFDSFRKKDSRMDVFLTDERILEFFNQRKTERLIQAAQVKDINNVGLYI